MQTMGILGVCLHFISCITEARTQHVTHLAKADAGVALPLELPGPVCHQQYLSQQMVRRTEVPFMRAHRDTALQALVVVTDRRWSTTHVGDAESTGAQLGKAVQLGSGAGARAVGRASANLLHGDCPGDCIHWVMEGKGEGVSLSGNLQGCARHQALQCMIMHNNTTC